MSGIFGIFNRNGKHVEKKTVDAMMNAMSYWDPDKRGVLMEFNPNCWHFTKMHLRW